MFRTLPVSLQSWARTNLAIVVLLSGSMYSPLAWAGNPTPEFTSADHTTFIANQFNSFEVTTDGNPTPTVGFSGSLPSGVSFIDNGNGTATISGTPALGAPGDYSSTLQACNSQSVLNGGETCVNQSFTLTVEEAPAFTSDDHVTFTVGQFDSFQVTTTGSPTPTLNYPGSLPSGVNFVDNGDGTGTLSGTADVGTFGDYPSTIEACNDVTCVDQSFTLTVQEAPSFTSSDNTTFTVGVPGTFTVTTTGTPTISLLLFTGSLPADVQFVDNGDGTATISGTPQGGTDGPYSLSFQACNSVDCTVGDFTLTVNPAGPPPPTCTAPPTGMIAWYPGDGNANDLIGVNDGTLEGGVTFVSGEVGQAFSLNGLNPDVAIGDVDLPGTFTVDAWINPTSLDGKNGATLENTIIGKHGNYLSFLLAVLSNGAIEGLVSSDGTSVAQYYTSPGAVSVGSWQHIAWSYDSSAGAGAKMKFYVNGTSFAPSAVNSDAAVIPGNTSASAKIGGGVEPADFFEGLIDEVELFNRVLSQSEIQAIYNAGSAGKCKCEIPLKPGGSLSSPNSGINDGYNAGRGTVFQANAALSIAGAGLWTSPIGNLTMTVNLWETTSYPSSNVNNTLLASASRTLKPVGFAYYDVGFNTPVVLQVGHKYHIEVVYDNAAEQNFYYGFDQGDVSLGAVDVLDGTYSGSTVNTEMPLIRLFTCDAPPAEFQLLNISGRAPVGTGDNVAIAGFIIHDDPANLARSHPNGFTASKRVIIRGLGPSLQINGTPVAGRLADPVLELHDESSGDVVVATNDNWGDAINASDIQASGFAPSDPNESAILATLDSGKPYTAILRGAGDTVGIGLVEVYDLEKSNSTHLANISTRAFVSTGDNVLIGGMIIRGNAGQVLVRGMGPSLAAANVANVLSDPQLDLYDGQGTHIGHNDNWKDSQETDIAATGFAPGNDSEAAILFTPAPANYTAIVSGVGGTTGVGMVEAYRFGPVSSK